MNNRQVAEGRVITSRGYSIFDETIADMFWPDVEAAAKAGAILLFPVGMIEQHGPHMVTGVDVYISYLEAKLVKQKLTEIGIQSLIIPPFYWGVAEVFSSFPGTFKVRVETMVNVLVDTFDSVRKNGFKRLFIINEDANPGHLKAIIEALGRGWSEVGLEVYLLDPGKYAPRGGATGEEHFVIKYAPLLPPGGRPVFFDKLATTHPGAFETSMMLSDFPELTRPDVLKSLLPTDIPREVLYEVLFQGGDNARALIDQGYFGDPQPDAEILQNYEYIKECVVNGMVEGIVNKMQSLALIKPKYGTRK